MQRECTDLILMILNETHGTTFIEQNSETPQTIRIDTIQFHMSYRASEFKI
jgi:hypothetical protein